MTFTGKNILVLGAGISGISVAEVLKNLGANVTLNDSKERHTISRDLSGVEQMGISLVLGRQDESLLEDIDYVVLSPGISIYSPIVEAAKKRGISVLSEIEVAYRISKAPIIAITGTNGKTTTTTLIGEILRKSKMKTVVGGNIGQALSREVLEAGPDGTVVAEISSFQLEAIENFRPSIAAILNVTPDHIDRHRTVDVYRQMKERVFENQTQKDYLVLNYDDAAVQAMASKAASQVLFFSRQQEVSAGTFVKNGMMVIKWQNTLYEICRTDELKIRGSHNIENALAAACVAFLAGVEPKIIADVFREFSGVEHRIEPVMTINGVEYYNDSKATNPESSIKALEAFDGHIILIAGGRDKNTDLGEFMQLAKKRVDHLILIGEAQERFAEAAKKYNICDIVTAKTFEEAVDWAYKLAKPPQVVLLSPACASYDMFKNYEERGKIFKDLVHSLALRR